MTDEARDPQAEQAGEGSAEARPRPRRRRRGGRGRSRGGSSSAQQQESTQKEPAKGSAEESADQTAGQDAATTNEASGKSGASTTPSGRTRKRSGSRRRRSSSSSSRSATKQPQPDVPMSDAGDGSAPSEGPASETKPKAGEDGQKPQETPSTRRRRRRRRRKPGERTENGDAAERSASTADASAAGAATAATAAIESVAARTPTRTSRAARRGSADRRRRRPTVHAPRRTDKTMLITEHLDRLQIAVVEGRELVEHYVTRTGGRSMVGNVYLGRVQNVLPGMEAAFVDIGRGRNGVLYAGEVSYDEDVDAGQRRIEQALKPGQSVIVQVTKDPLKGKGARLTAQISLPGRYLVYVPDGGASGISKRLPDAERERLRKIMKRIRPSEAGVIVRTAAEAATEEELAADLDRLKKAWESIRRKSRRGGGPPAPYEEADLLEGGGPDVFSPVP